MSLIEWLDALLYLSPAALIFGIGLGGYLYPRIHPLYRTVLLYFFIALCTDLTGRYLGAVKGDNLLLIPIFGLLELMVFTWMYFRYLLTGRRILLKVFAIIAHFCIIMDIFHTSLQSPSSFQSYGRVMDHLALTLYALTYFKDLLQGKKEQEDTFLTFNSAVLVFFPITLLLYLPINFLVNLDSEVKFYFWSINFGCTLLFYLFLISLIWKNGKTRTP